MNSAKRLFSNSFPRSTSRFSTKNERKILKAILISRVHQLLSEIFQEKIQCADDSTMECYAMDNQVIKLLIQSIVETEEYTLEGIARYTHIPFDVIYDAACGINSQLSVTPWSRVVDLYLQVKPDVSQILMEKLFAIKDKGLPALSLFLNEG